MYVVVVYVVLIISNPAFHVFVSNENIIKTAFKHHPHTHIRLIFTTKQSRDRSWHFVLACYNIHNYS